MEGARVMIGPCGGYGGAPWEVKDISNLRGISVRHHHWIDGISFSYIDSQDVRQRSPLFGGGGGYMTEIYFGDNEHLLCITGYYDRYVTSLVFVTNLHSYGPYGRERGTPFALPTLGNNIIGLHGRSWRYLDGIGLYVLQG